LYEALEKYRIKLPPHEYAEQLRKLQPEFAKLTAEIDKTSNELRRKMTAKVESLVSTAFKR
jgi:hypothetical protein